MKQLIRAREDIMCFITAVLISLGVSYPFRMFINVISASDNFFSKSLLCLFNSL